MTSTNVGSDASPTPLPGSIDMKLEVAVIPVSEVDRAKRFYQNLGWHLDADFPISDDFRIIQFTPPGSQASIIFGKGVTTATSGSDAGRLLLAVHDIEAARADLVARGVDVSEVFHGPGGHHAGTAGRIPGPDPQHQTYASFASFTDPDGNEWRLQEITERLPGR